MSVSLRSGSLVTVATAGTAVPLSTASPNIVALRVFISAPASNTGAIFIGGDDVSATNGLAVAPGQLVDLGYSQELISPNDIYVDAATNGNQVSFSYLMKD